MVHTKRPPAADDEVEALAQALAAPFERQFVKFRPGATSGSRALAIPYVDARVIQDRLDEVVGPLNWQDEYEFLPDGSVLCRLRLRLQHGSGGGGEWITKMDVGGPSEQPDEGDRRKAAVSDALKRAAVKFGVGRYLYRLPQTWVDYDPQKKQLKNLPPLPEPGGQAVRTRTRGKQAPPAAAAAEAAAPQHSAAAPPGKLPANGEEMLQRLKAYEARLVRQGLCQPDDLVRHVREAGAKEGHPNDLSAWSGPAILLAVEATRAFEGRLKKAEKVVA